MKKVFIFSLFLILLSVSGCQKRHIVSEPEPIPKKRGKFKREVFDADKDPDLVAVGKLKVGRSWCAITLVAEDIAVTAGHCFVPIDVNLFEVDKSLLKFTDVIFRSRDGERVPDVKVDKILKFKIEPDYAIVKLNKKIPNEVIKPLRLSDMIFGEIRVNREKLGCAGFNGDNELGDRGNNLTISRNIRIYPDRNKKKRIDTNCVSTNGGSGGLFFEERFNSETNKKEHYLLGVIWGVTNDNFNAKGERVNRRNNITSITPLMVFRDELVEVISEN